MGAKWQRFIVDLDKEYNSRERKAIAQEVVNKVVQRSREGKDKEGSSFPAYSDEYKESLDFKIAGKGSKVNLTLSGDMLDALDRISDSPGKALIGYKNGTNENAKADGNVRGTYGQSSPISGKKRDFMGISDTDLQKILKKYPLNNKEKRDARVLLIESVG